MARLLRFSFGVVAYFFFFVTFVYLVGFVTNQYVPRSIDIGPIVGTWQAVLTNLGLIALFGIQHSVMARPGFKATLTRFWPQAIERSLYVMLTGVVLCLIYWFWRPIPELLWSLEGDWGRTLIWVIAASGWGIVFISTFLISHFELFGLHQIWSDLRSRSLPVLAFRQPLFYKLVRHPIYTGFLLAFWATPDMTYGHLLFATGMTFYIIIGIRYEERDLKTTLGDVYVDYSRQVGMVIPGVGKNKL